MATDRKETIRQAALSDLEKFIQVVQPNRLLGQCHRELISWWNRPSAFSHQLVLLPRDHQKSALMALRVAWEITKNPAIRVLYISSTSNLAEKQLKFIKDILTSKEYRFLWPEMVNVDESKREKWTTTEISVDHPQRKAEFIRDPTVFIAGLTTGITGLHCDIAVLDDVVVEENAYSAEGRDKVRAQASYLASIAGTDSRMWACGTRYHPKDLYNDFAGQVVEIYDDNGDIEHSYNLWEVHERQVEDRGDGTGNFLWPKQLTPDGKKSFGFNQEILAKKKSQYAHDITRFRAQYYNNPNDLSTATIQPSMFQYYNRTALTRETGKWYYKGNRLNIFAAVDFAYTTGEKSDYTAIVVIGVDHKSNIYILDIDRFKTSKMSEFYERILRLHVKWDFRKIRAEVTAAQMVIVKDLKESYIRPAGLALSVEEHKPMRRDGSKEERIEANLQPRYANLQMWHYTGGQCSLLEDELISQRPAHDDMKDCLAACVEIAVPPTFQAYSKAKPTTDKQLFHSRFGGVGILLGIVINAPLLSSLFF